MFWKARWKLGYWRFNRAVRRIQDTPPMPVRPGHCTIVSMVAPRDVLMYLVSMKAFYRRIGGGKLVAIVQRDVTPASRKLIAEHFPGIDIQPLEAIDTGVCQRGGTWERLVYILRRAEQGEYVVQIDCDVMPTGADISELAGFIRARTAFAMADNAQIVPVREAAAFSRGLSYDYVGNRVEGLLDRLPGAEHLRYLRGSSGLAGFAPGGFPLRRLEEFHQAMEDMLGSEDWRKWGTEQCGSNFAVANTSGASALPFPQYASFNPQCDRERAKMYHFIGTFRFDEGVFAKLAKREIEALNAGAAMRRAA